MRWPNMITLRAKLLCVGALVLLTGLALLLVQTWQSSSGPKQWLIVSAPAFGSRMTPTGAVPTVFLVLSNAGPRTLEPNLSWFEWRSKSGLARMEDNQAWRSFPPLSPGRARKVALDLPQAVSIDEAPLFCCEITWFERGSFVRRKAEALAGSDNPNIRPWNVDWVRPWQSKPLTNGVAFASNVAVADYFRSVYRMDEAYFERTMREIKASSSTTGELRMIRFPTRDELLTNSAWRHYLTFRQSM